MSKHKHVWDTQYIEIEGVDCPSGMKCDCGQVLRQDEVEDIINEWQSTTPKKNEEVSDEKWRIDFSYSGTLTED